MDTSNTAREFPQAQKPRRSRAKGTRGIDPDLVNSIRDGELHRVRTLWHNIGAPTPNHEIISYQGHVATVSNFTFDEFRLYGRIHGKHPRFVAPCDATRDEIKAYLKTQRLKRNAQARRDRRAAAKERTVAAIGIDCRASAIVTVLDTEHWQTIRDMAQSLKGLAVFYQPNGRPLTSASLRRVIARELEKPAMTRVVITGKKPAKRGDVVVVRLRSSKLMEADETSFNPKQSNRSATSAQP
jgi:hypothetical protein